MEGLIWITGIVVLVTFGGGLYIQWKMRPRGDEAERPHGRVRSGDLEGRLRRLENEVEGIKQNMRGQGT